MPLFSILRLIYFALNLLLAARLFFILRAARTHWTIQLFSCLVVVAFSIAYPLSRQIEGNSAWHQGVAFTGTIWLAFFLHALLLYLAIGLFCLANRYGQWISVPPERLARRRLTVCGGIILAAALITAAGWLNTQLPTLREITLRAQIERPLRIIAVSDIHLGRIVPSRLFSTLVDLIEPQNPDLVIFAGDTLDDHDGFDPNATRESLQRLNPKLGIWGILGNHEYISGRKGDRSAQLLEQGGIHILRDGWVNLDDQLLLVGRNDYDFHRRHVGIPRKTLPEILADLPERLKSKPRLLLDHNPVHLEEAEAAQVFLQISGHTHNGQLFPFNYLVADIYENAYGYSRRGNTHYWVSSGAGTWGPQNRTTGRPEILLIRIEPMS